MEFSRQDYWSGLLFLSPEDLPNPGIELWSPALRANSLPIELQGSPWGHQHNCSLSCLCMYTGKYQLSSVAQSCPTLCDPMNCSTPGFPVHHHSWILLKLMTIQSVMPSNHLTLCRPLLLPQTELQFEFPESYSKFSLAIYFTYGNVCLHGNRSQVSCIAGRFFTV